MNKTFDYGNEQLADAEQDLALLKVVASETEDLLTQKAAELLEEAKLEQYFELCELVKKDPDLVKFYTRALERNEVLRAITNREELSESQGAARQALGSLAAKTAIDKNNYEAFFTLYAPDEPVYISYANRNNIITDSVVELIPVGTSEGVTTPDVLDSSEQDSSQDIDSIPDEASMPNERDDSPAGELVVQDKETLNEIIVINGEVAELSEQELFIIKKSIELGGENLSTKMFITEDGLIPLINKIIGKKISRSGYSQRFTKLIDGLNEIYPDIFIHNGKQKGGSRYRLNEIYNIEFTTQTVVTSEQTGESELAPVQDETAANKPSPSKKPLVPRKKSGRSEVEFKPMDGKNKLLENGVMITGKIQAYTEAEKALVEIFTNAPRKQPYSPKMLHDLLGEKGLIDGGIEETKLLIKGLEDKLPSGWLISVQTGKDSPDGWRFAKGIRVVRQHR